MTVDWLGSFLFVASLTSFLIPLTWVSQILRSLGMLCLRLLILVIQGGVMYPWLNWRTTIPMQTGILGFVLFLIWSNYSRVEPILRGSMFKDPTALTSYFGTVVHGMFLWSALYYMVSHTEV
jgi:hypothetical protein